MGDAGDTIFALSSGAGVAAVAVVRISGPQAAAALRMLTQRPTLPEARKLVLRRLYEPGSGVLMDEALVVWLPAPCTFSGEDMVELHVHGSRAVVDAVLTALSGIDGLRPAQRGEFTQRAMLNGRMTLLQVEGLADLLQAETPAQRKLALTGVTGGSSDVAQRWRRCLLSILARVEAAIDFIDEEDVAAQALSGLGADVAALVADMQAALDAARPAERLREGVRVVIAGPPNAGKSSLLNWLAGREVAIVSEVPGTTRDVLEVRLDMDGIPVLVSDTAGLRTHGVDTIERIGMQRAQDVLREADIVLHMHAPDVPALPLAGLVPDALVLRVFNKADLASSIPSRNDFDAVISVRHETGIDSLLQRLCDEVRRRYGQGESALFARARQRAALAAALARLQQVPQQDAMLADMPVELVAEQVRMAVRHLDELLGRLDVEEVLGEIFSSFCIGK